MQEVNPRKVQDSLIKDQAGSSDNKTFMYDDGFRTIIYNMWGRLHVNIDFIQNKMIEGDEVSPSVASISCRLILDYVGGIIYSRIGGAISQDLIPKRNVLSSEVLTEIETAYFSDEKRAKAFNSLVLMLTRSLAGSNTGCKDDIIRCIYGIKKDLLTSKQ